MEITTNLINRYTKGMIYKLCCKDANITEIYVGSTVNKHRRKAHHKSACNNPNSMAYNLYVYQFIRENGGFENWDLVILEEYPADNKNDLVWKEREWVELLKPSLNSQRPITTLDEYHENQKKYREENPEKVRESKKKYYEKNKEKVNERKKIYYENNPEKLSERNKKYRENNPEKYRESQKKYRENNREKINERVKCDICDKDLSKSSLSRHKKTFHNNKK